ncbi:hypothetical protein Ancab_000026 [Ancistrocladus abbreviatus]
MDPVDEDEQLLGTQRSSCHLRCNSSEEEPTPDGFLETKGTKIEGLNKDKADRAEQASYAASEKPNSGGSHSLTIKLTKLEIPDQNDLCRKLWGENPNSWPSMYGLPAEDPNDGDKSETKKRASVGSEHDDGALELDLSDEKDEENKEESIPEEAIFRRINSHKETKSYQLGRQLSCKWCTGAGPRIGCVRDYPSELQFRALEQVNLSPRSSSQIKASISPRCVMSSRPKMAVSQRSAQRSSAVCSPLGKGAKP